MESAVVYNTQRLAHGPWRIVLYTAGESDAKVAAGQHAGRQARWCARVRAWWPFRRAEPLPAGQQVARQMCVLLTERCNSAWSLLRASRVLPVRTLGGERVLGELPLITLGEVLHIHPSMRTPD